MDTNQKSKTGLIVVDVQNDFCEGGSLAVSNASQIMPIVNDLIDNTKFDSIFYTQDWHPKDHWSFASNHQGQKPFNLIKLETGVEQMLWPDHCVQNTNGAKFHEKLKIHKNGIIVQKGKQTKVDSYSGFGTNPEDTGLLKLLKDQNIKTVFVVGLALDYCVKSTAVDAAKNGYKTYIVEEGTKAVDPSNIENIKKSINDNNVQIISINQIKDKLQ